MMKVVILVNKSQKEVQQAHLNAEKHLIKLLERVYGQARNDCEKKIMELSSRTDLENLQSIIYQKQYQEALKKQLEGILDNLQSEEFTSIADYLQKSYHDGYVGVMYDLTKQGIPLIIPINQEQVVKALQTDSKLSKGLYARLGEDVNYLKRSIRAELSRGIANGSTWNEIAGKIAKGMNSPFNKSYNRAILIARTEGHRIQQRSALDGQFAAKEKGADVLKQWDSTLDNRTRPHHRMLDGQIRELDEDFEIDGLKATAPGHFGKASEDCNCRCCLLQRARWALDEDELNELKERAAYFGLDKTKDFEEFKQKYLKLPKNADTMELKEIQLGELETAYGRKHSKAIRQYLENAPNEIKRVWDDCVADFHCLEPKYRGDKAFYSPSFDGVKLNISKVAKGSDYQTPYQVVFHEYGHHADYILNRKYGDKNAFIVGKTTSVNQKRAFSETYKNGIFGKTLKKEANKAVEDWAKNQISVEAIEENVDIMIKHGLLEASEKENYIKHVLSNVVITEDTYKDFCKYIKDNLTLMQRSDISDMFEPIMPESCDYPFGVGHGSSYWRNRDNGKEGFAEMYSAMVNNPESLEQIKRFFPESFKIFQEMLGVVK